MERRAELDWLRVILVLAVFLHHALMPFNGDSWHIMNQQSSKYLDDIMVFFEQLRLPSLFVIAGAGSMLLLSKVSDIQFALDKVSRLLLPLVVGVLLIIPPQTYYEHKTQFDSLLDAYLKTTLELKTNHLWFIEYLVVFSLIAIPLKSALNSSPGKKFQRHLITYSKHRYGLFSLVALLILIRVPINIRFYEDGEFTNQLAPISFYGFFFIMGMILISAKDAWSNMAIHRRTNTYIFLTASILFYFYYFIDFSPYFEEQTRWAIWWLICSIISWSGALVIFGYGQRLFVNTPQWLKTTNQLIYPFYILHQTVIIFLAYYITKIGWPISLKSFALIFSALFLTSSICYFLIKPFNPVRLLFGLKLNTV